MSKVRTDWTREELIAICERAVVQQKDWCDRDSPDAHLQLGTAWVLLKAGCDFYVQSNTDEKTIWLAIEHKTFSSFEYGRGNEDSAHVYLPTPARLDARQGRDWY